MNLVKTSISLRREPGPSRRRACRGAVLLAGLAWRSVFSRSVVRSACSQFTATAAQVEASLDRSFEPAEQVPL